MAKFSSPVWIVQTYSDYPGMGWSRYGRLIINFAHNRAISIFFNGELLWVRSAILKTVRS